MKNLFLTLFALSLLMLLFASCSEPETLKDNPDGEVVTIEDSTTDTGSDIDDPSTDATSDTEDATTDTDNDVTTDASVTAYAAPINIDLTGITALATKPSSNISLNIALSNLQLNGVSFSLASTCDELGVAEGDTYTTLVDGSCISDVEFWDSGKIYGKYFVPVDVSADSSISFATVSEPVSFITDGTSENNVHVLPGHPIKRNTFSNKKIVESRNGKPVYINSSGKLISFDVSTDTENVLVDEVVSNFSIKKYSDGDHYVVDAVDGVKRIKPDATDELLPEITAGNWHDMSGDIQYQSGTTFKRMLFDADGNIIKRDAVSYPEKLDLFIYDYEAYTALYGSGAPSGIYFSGTISGCTNNKVAGQEIMICNGKAFRVKGVYEDLEIVDLCGYGHCGVTNFSTVLGCSGANHLYFYGGIDTNGNTRLTWINDLTGEYRDILDTHKITDLDCVSDSEIYVTGTIGDLTETLHITGGDTVSPVVTVVDSQLTDVITP